MNKYLSSMVVTALIGLAITLGYFIFQNQKLQRELLKNVNQSPSPPQSVSSTPNEASVATPVPSAQILTKEGVQEAIRTYTNLKDHKDLEPFLTVPKVSVILNATECCGEITTKEAIKQMDYINEGIIFDFNQESAVVKNLKSKNERLKDTYMGLSKTKELLIAYTLDSQNKITSIEMSASWKLYDQ